MDSLGGSAVLTDYSSNISSFSTSSVEDKHPNCNVQLTLNKKQKPSLIDSDFKNELEKLFSGSNRTSLKKSNPITFCKTESNTEETVSISKRRSILNNCLESKLAIIEAQKNTENTKSEQINPKLRDFLSLMSGNLIKDNSDLLVEHKIESLINFGKNDELSKSEPDLSENLNILDLLTLKTSDQYNNRLLIDDDKILKLLIKMLVKSCRIFDAATTKTDENMSYWRYANPVVAVLKSDHKNETSLRLGPNKKFDISTQTNESTNLNLEEPVSTTLDSEKTNFRTIIEIDQDKNTIANSIVELVTESFKLPTLHDDYDTEMHIYQNENDSIYVNYDLTQSNKSSLEINDIENIYDDIDKMYENITRPEQLTMSNSCKKKFADLSEILKSKKLNRIKSKNFRARRNIQQRSSNKHYYHYYKNNNRAQDETLRDAENISDIENESDIDQWIDLNENDYYNDNANDSDNRRSLDFKNDKNLKTSLSLSASGNRNILNSLNLKEFNEIEIESKNVDSLMKNETSQSHRNENEDKNKNKNKNKKIDLINKEPKSKFDSNLNLERGEGETTNTLNSIINSFEIDKKKFSNISHLDKKNQKRKREEYSQFDKNND